MNLPCVPGTGRHTAAAQLAANAVRWIADISWHRLPNAQRALRCLLAATALTTLTHNAMAADVPRLQIYLLMGQSNMAGRDTSDTLDQAADPRIVALDAEGNWGTARDPIHAKTSRSESGVGPGIGFAREMLTATPAIKIGLVPTAVGGTALRRWVRGGDLYEAALSRARVAAQSGVIRGVLWHQGESDAKTHGDADTYGSRLAQMFNDLRQDLGQPDLPIVVGQIGTFVLPSSFPAADTVRSALRRMPEALPDLAFVDSIDLDHKGDHLHFNSASARELGRRFARAMQAIQASQAVAIWPEGKAPGQLAAQAETTAMPERRDALRITQVSKPTLTIYRVSAQPDPTPAVIVVPGGGYRHVVLDKEGSNAAAWFTAQGITALVLKYRVPDNRDGALLDLQRAIQLVRANAAAWKIDPRRVGVVGFSAGGHLAARASTSFEHCPTWANEATDAPSCRPDFALLVYPAYLDEDGGPASSPSLHNESMPPTLIVHTDDDRKYVTGSRSLAATLRAAGHAVQTLFYATGGHGYGISGNGDAKEWARDAQPWLKAQTLR